MRESSVRVLGATAISLVLVLAPQPAAGAPPTERQARWAWPVPPPHTVVRGFEAPATSWGAGHRGIDLAAATGTPVTAPADGAVAFAGTVVDRGVVSIAVDGDLLATVEPVEPRVAAGAPVRRGQVIAVVSQGGSHAPGVLHLGARLHGEYVSPLLYLGPAPRAVLLPAAAFPAP